VDEKNKGIAIEGHIGTWHVIDETEREGVPYLLLEHDAFGDESPFLIVKKESLEVVVDDGFDGFLNLDEYLASQGNEDEPLFTRYLISQMADDPTAVCFVINEDGEEIMAFKDGKNADQNRKDAMAFIRSEYEKTTRGRQFIEARERLFSIKGLIPDIITYFDVSTDIHVSENQPIGGILYWANQYPEVLKAIKEFEERYSAVVYHVNRTYSQFGELLSFFYVSNDPEEWAMDRADLAEGRPVVYVENLNDPFSSEFGSIGFEIRAGGIYRTA